MAKRKERESPEPYGISGWAVAQGHERAQGKWAADVKQAFSQLQTRHRIVTSSQPLRVPDFLFKVMGTIHPKTVYIK